MNKATIIIELDKGQVIEAAGNYKGDIDFAKNIIIQCIGEYGIDSEKYTEFIKALVLELDPWDIVKILKEIKQITDLII